MFGHERNIAMRPYRTALPALVCLLSLCTPALAQLPSFSPPKPYEQRIEVPYGEAKGETLWMDIFIPTGENRLDFYQPNDHGHGLGIVDVISGGYKATRDRLSYHETARLFHIFCARGYTVFAVSCGSHPKFTAFEMVEHVEQAIRWIKANAAEYNIDPDRLGITGASAGGHLATMAAILPKPAVPDAEDPLLKYSTHIAAAAVMFPPTDFLNWKDGEMAGIDRKEKLLFSDGVDNHSMEEIVEAARRISPVYHVQGGLPPFLIVHGDEDPVVPLEQSKRLRDRLIETGNEAELIIKEGGGHFWITLPEEIIKVADWLDQKLAPPV
jgi:acetyl esterase/lipase